MKISQFSNINSMIYKTYTCIFGCFGTKITKIQPFIIVSIFSFMISSCTLNLEDRLIGEWQGPDHTGEIASILFEENKNAKFIKNSLILEGSYNVKISKSVIELDLFVKRVTGTVKIPMILRFLTDDEIQLRMSEDGVTRPTEFSTPENIKQIVLERQ